MKLNPFFKKLKEEYVFEAVLKKVKSFAKKHPHISLINLGVGDVALPLAPSIAEAIVEATKEMTLENKMKGYGPSVGYTFLRETISSSCYTHLGISSDEIFVSEGTNNDTTNIQELFSQRCKIGILNPSYPAYLNSALLSGRGSYIFPIPATSEHQFIPTPPTYHLDLIYLCSPNNPTGIAMTHSQLKLWVDYAIQEKSVLVIDNAYEAFVTSPEVPRSIYEIEGAKKVCVECRTFSKSAGFSGLRVAYMVIPEELQKGKLRKMWIERQGIKSNGISYPMQRGAAAVFSELGQLETKKQVHHYLEQTHKLKASLLQLGLSCVGGTDSPYLWVKIPREGTSWDFFEELLNTAHLVVTPGSGFGDYGEGYIRISGFLTTTQTNEALQRLQSLKL